MSKKKKLQKYEGAYSLIKYSSECMKDLVESMEQCGKYAVGDVVRKGKHVFVVLMIHVHHESDCAWALVVKVDTGTWYEVDIPYLKHHMKPINDIPF